MKTNSIMKTTSRMKTTLKNEGDLKIEDDLKNWPFPQIILPLNSYLKFFWCLLTLTATRQLTSNRISYQLSKPEMEFHMIDIIYVALPMCAQTKKTTLSWDDMSMSVHRLVPVEITCLTSDVSISISTMGKTAKDGKCKLSLSNLMMKPETK